jgi:putative NADH-flavin reductase
MKTIALFGGSGQTGQAFLDKALEAGYRLRALARTPEKIPQKSERLTVLQGDVLEEQDVRHTISGTDVAVSLFGHVKGSPKWLQSDGTYNIIQAMRAENIRKIISLSGGGLPFERDEPKLADKLIRGIMKIAVPKVLNDAVRHAEILRSSQLDWVIVRGPRLTNEAERGDYRVGWVGVNASTSIGRKDLADFILQQVEKNDYIHQMPFVSY